MAGQLIQVTADTRDLTVLFNAAKQAEGKLQVQLRRDIKKAAQPVVAGVKDAAGFSTRIPGAVKSKVSFAAKGASVTVYVDPAAAPEAAPLNHRGKGGTFRHPTFGNREAWVNQKARPFMDQGVRAGLPGFEKAIDEAVDAWIRKLGFQ